MKQNKKIKEFRKSKEEIQKRAGDKARNLDVEPTLS